MNKLFFVLWLILGIASMIISWTHILTWVIGTLFWIYFVQDKGDKK